MYGDISCSFCMPLPCFNLFLSEVFKQNEFMFAWVGLSCVISSILVDIISLFLFLSLSLFVFSSSLILQRPVVKGRRATMESRSKTPDSVSIWHTHKYNLHSIGMLQFIYCLGLASVSSLPGYLFLMFNILFMHLVT